MVRRDSPVGFIMLATVVLFFSSGVSAAQTGIHGDIHGRVVDKSAAVLPGVSVTVESPVLMGNRTVVTDAEGSYRFVALPQGDAYTLRFELEGFRTVVRQGISVQTRKTTTLDVELEVGALAESIVVTGQAPLVDVESGRQGMSITGQLLETIPTARDPYSVLAMAPGGIKSVPNVGGATTDVFQNAVVYGTINRRMNMNGAETAVRFSDGRYPAFDAYEEMVVETAGAGADTRRPGGGYSLEMVAKTGGNELRGIVSAFWFNSSLVGSNIDDRLRADGVTSSSDTHSLSDASASVGGPFVKDRLWWFASVRRFKAVRRVIGTSILQEGLMVPVVANVTLQANRGNRVQGFYTYNYKTQPQAEIGRFTTHDASFFQDSFDELRQVKWLNSAMGKSVFEAQAFHYRMWFPTLPQEGSGAPMRDLVTGLNFNGQLRDHTERDFNRYQISASAQHFRQWGRTSHDLKTGVDGFGLRYRELMSVGNGPDWQVRYDFRNGAPAFATIYDGPVNVLRNEDGFSAYAQDRISLGRLTANLGVRWDWYNTWWPAQATPEGNRWESVFDRVEFPKRDHVLRWSTLAPRLSGVYRINGSGRSVVKVSYGHYPSEMDPSVDTDFINPNGLRSIRYIWRGDLNGDSLLQLNEVGNVVSRFLPGLNSLDPNLENPTVHETGLVFEQDLGGNMAVTVQYAYTQFRGTPITSNSAIPSSAYIPRTVVDPGVDGAVNTGDDRELTVYNIHPDFVRGAANVRSNYPGVQRTAHTLSSTLQKRLSRGWQALATYSYNQVSETRVTDLSNPNNLINVKGRASVDAPHTLTLLGSYHLPWDMQVSGQWQINSGFPYDRLLQVFGLNQGSITIVADPTGTYRHDTRSLLDVRLEKQLQIGTTRLGLMLEGFNVLNNNASVDFTGTDLGRGRITGGNFGRVSRIVPARTARLGIRYSF
ncbi:MAG TPA: carboxypeptidase regulatory-like domain-containing protein [Vicinamibacterales bacterium]|nr:carboxypeptidase regulatory-like domain-containing protein [Vicinamibacterales bacterium]